ncbi:very short patch repair endonuclease [Brevibacterium sp. ZH18]|uniref:very short patch repair endonuclease n=1 Tax=Brevibacterium sp. ZH18 TaxID=2927784 RepID=UPI001F618645|nr:very short patch repair endonuclease [Brevibacterium sp. ZH18]MCI4013007.1 very short patch repair endonuclease [Brevibacterium sp. ZH18]
MLADCDFVLIAPLSKVSGCTTSFLHVSRHHSAPVKGIRTHADIVFAKAKIAVFVDGCFWHGCPDHFVMPKSNTKYWSDLSCIGLVTLAEST